jgi:hypothetical protein
MDEGGHAVRLGVFFKNTPLVLNRIAFGFVAIID